MTKLTESELIQYRAIKNEIEDIEFRIKQHQVQKQQMSTTKVKGSLSEFPYTEAHFNVVGPDHDEIDRRINRIAELERKKRDKQAELIEKEHELYDYIFSIPESEIRQIFILRFIDGWSQEAIGKKLHMDRSTVSKKITKYIEE